MDIYITPPPPQAHKSVCRGPNCALVARPRPAAHPNPGSLRGTNVPVTHGQPAKKNERRADRSEVILLPAEDNSKYGLVMQALRSKAELTHLSTHCLLPVCPLGGVIL